MRLTVNLSTKPSVNWPIVDRVCGLAFLLFAGGLIWNFVQSSRISNELYHVTSQMKTLEVQTTALPLPTEQQLKKLEQQVTFANNLMKRRNNNQLALLDHLEQLTPQGITLNGLQPLDRDGRLLLEGRAASFKTLQRYLSKLAASEVLKDPLLLRQGETDSKEGNQPCTFTISCQVVFQ